MAKQNEDSFESYYQAVKIEAMGLGYKPVQIAVFYSNIEECYEDGKTIEQCVEEVF